MSLDAKLDVIAVISNPRRYKSRYNLYRSFRKHMEESPEVRLLTVELQHNDRPFEITTGEPGEVQLRSSEEMWLKEALINVGISRLPSDSKYVAWIDADVRFARDDWAKETIYALQHHKIVQPWSHCIDLGPKYEPLVTHHSFCKEYCNGEKYDPGKSKNFWHPGYAWGARKEVLDKIGGLIDFGVLGAGDHHIATAVIGSVHSSIHGKVSESYKKKAKEWQDIAYPAIQEDIGYVPGLLTHAFHGKKRDRRYQERWQILIDNEFDPDVDIVRDTNGLWKLAGNKPKLRDGLRGYLASRNEDSIDSE